MTLWLTLGVNSLALGGLLFLLSAGFSLIFGLMRIPNLLHGSFFMLGAYLGVSLLATGIVVGGTVLGVTVPRITLIPQIPNFYVAALIRGSLVAALRGVIERFLLR